MVSDSFQHPCRDILVEINDGVTALVCWKNSWRVPYHGSTFWMCCDSNSTSGEGGSILLTYLDVVAVVEYMMGKIPQG